jgi:hypothetical protein
VDRDFRFSECRGFASLVARAGATAGARLRAAGPGAACAGAGLDRADEAVGAGGDRCDCRAPGAGGGFELPATGSGLTLGTGAASGVGVAAHAGAAAATRSVARPAMIAEPAVQLGRRGGWTDCRGDLRYHPPW